MRYHGAPAELRDIISTPRPGLVLLRRNLIEGFRPKRILRIFAGDRKLDHLPKEESVYK